MNFLGRSLLTATALAPVAMVYSVLGFIEGETLIGIILAAISPALVLLCLWLLNYRKSLERVTLTITAAECADRENIGIMLLYVMPLLEISLAEITWVFFIPAVVIFVSLIVTESSYHFNPLLKFLGWHFFRVGTPEGVTYLLITKKKRIPNVDTKFTVGEITSYTLVERDDG